MVCLCVSVEEGNGRGRLCPRRGTLSPSHCMLHPILHLRMKPVSEHYPETCLCGGLLCHAEMSKPSAATALPASVESLSIYTPHITTREETPPCRQRGKKREGHGHKKCLLLEILQLLLSQLCNGSVLSCSERWAGNARLMWTLTPVFSSIIWVARVAPWWSTDRLVIVCSSTWAPQISIVPSGPPLWSI